VVWLYRRQHIEAKSEPITKQDLEDTWSGRPFRSECQHSDKLWQARTSDPESKKNDEPAWPTSKAVPVQTHAHILRKTRVVEIWKKYG
jgi:hypothetical protein